MAAHSQPAKWQVNPAADSSEESSGSTNGHTVQQARPFGLNHEHSRPFGSASAPSNNIFLTAATGTQNPFAVKSQKSSGHGDSSCDSLSGEEEAKPIIAPPTFRVSKLSSVEGRVKVEMSKPGPSLPDSSSNSNFTEAKPHLPPAFGGFGGQTSFPVTAMGKCLLRPSALSAQTAMINSQKKGAGNKENREHSPENLEKTPPLEKACSRVEKDGTALQASDTNTSDSPPEVKSESAFVFGQNMTERVVNAPQEDSSEEKDKEEEQDEDEKEESEEDSPGKHAAGSRSPKTLAESAQEYEARQSKRHFNEVTVITGEENESNVLQIHGKLFRFEHDTKNWLEKGAGLLRLNDMQGLEEGDFQSRLVMRSHGSLRVILNTKIWSGMMVEKASKKSVRVTAVENGDPRIYQILVNLKDAEQLFNAIEWRIQSLKIREQTRRDTKRTHDDVDSKSVESRDTDALASASKKSKAVDSPGRADSLSLTPTTDAHEESNSSLPDTETEVSNDSLPSGRLTVPSTSVPSSPPRSDSSCMTPEKSAQPSSVASPEGSTEGQSVGDPCPE
ncbi:PREDICTED: E3 SUMO-protein ligase RanBP2-like isoform X2 [Priapulus caudatus]|uniref:E3 SUMO-protein ligase RanBP2-like isoform X2 n=1 Tax=Priapulus caudatus TaxID=37621 RepID=A0ABM1E567_PRICU|nr:PREDICTED: E3 SUMO-protein ligase RanBP2-like isoform X2 [Priapulus caudatus]